MRRIAEDGHLGLADDRRPLLLAALATTAGGFLGCGARTAGVGIELHPDGQFFFAENFAGDHQEAVHAVAQQRLPELANERKLSLSDSGAPLRERAEGRAD